ncbi:MAG: hypothetical protein QG630_433 [Patescibacteria group bacterium]|nr:hypothetical protein [Patescibacteria group bacterium]
MKKYIGVISGIILALSMGIAYAQITGGGAQVTCIRYNPDGSCAQRAVSGNIQVGGGSGGVGPGANNGAPNTSGGMGGSPAYQQGGAGPRQQQTADLSFISNLLAQFGGIIAMLPKILLGVAVVLFFWYLIKYFIIDADKDGEARSKAVKGMGLALAGIFVMVTLWGIIAFFGNALDINPNAQVNAPQLPR